MKRIILCNWKMYFSSLEATNWLGGYGPEIDELAHETGHSLVFFPSVDACAHAVELSQEYRFTIGAQDCSQYAEGAYTGQIQAQSLENIGCGICIIGHSETRMYLNITDTDVAQKLMQLNATSLEAVICVGESHEEYDQSISFDVIERQLNAVIPHMESRRRYYIAYEPLWSIGTGVVPDNEYIERMSDHIRSLTKDSPAEIRVVYGGSVNVITAQQLGKLRAIDGFLIGKSSTNFQELKKIVLL